MSADRQRLKSAIRNIAKTDPEQRAQLGESSNKGGKASAAGVGVSEAEESRLCCDGSTSSSANPGTSERDPDADGAGQDGLDSSDPAKLSSGDGTLSGVTDCATGEPICFAGDGFIPPDGWGSPSDAPVDPDWVECYHWERSGDIGGGEYWTPDEAADGAGWAWDFRTRNGPDPTDSVSYYREDGIILGTAYAYDNGTSRDFCDADQAPRADAWPEDGCTNLAIVNGSIVGSKYDPENSSGSYSAPRDSIALCDPENGARITLRPSADSGWKTIDAINGGDGYLYKPNGERIARRISADEFADPDL